MRLGLNCIAYRNTGDYGSPSWNEVPNAKNVTLNLEKGEADVSVRGNNGWRAVAGTLKNASVDLEIQYDPEDADYEALRDAFFDNTNIDMAFVDGDINESGTEGLRAEFVVMNMTRTEALEESVMTTFTLRPALTGNAPYWLEV